TPVRGPRRGPDRPRPAARHRQAAVLAAATDSLRVRVDAARATASLGLVDAGGGPEDDDHLSAERLGTFRLARREVFVGDRDAVLQHFLEFGAALGLVVEDEVLGLL